MTMNPTQNELIPEFKMIELAHDVKIRPFSIKLKNIKYESKVNPHNKLTEHILDITLETQDRFTGKFLEVKFYEEFQAENRDEFLHMVKYVIHHVIMHEVCEAIWQDGKLAFDPHKHGY